MHLWYLEEHTTRQVGTSTTSYVGDAHSSLLMSLFSVSYFSSSSLILIILIFHRIFLYFSVDLLQVDYYRYFKKNCFLHLCWSLFIKRGTLIYSFRSNLFAEQPRLLLTQVTSTQVTSSELKIN